MSTPNRRLVVLENSTVDAMAADPSFADAFPCLRAVREAPAAAPGCRKCGRASGKDAAVYNAAKSCLATMPQADRDRLKAKMGASTIRVVTPQGILDF